MNAQYPQDALLTWCSEMGSGTTVQFAEGARSLGLRPWPAARVLSQLGHVEFGWDSRRFAAAPTTLTAIPGLPGRMLLTGARPLGLIAALAQHAAEHNFDVDVSRDLCHQFGYAPSTALIDADPDDAPAFCETAGIMFSPCASTVIAQRLPLVTISIATVSHRPDPRFPHAAIDPHTFEPRWDTSGEDPRTGLWLYRTWGSRRSMVLHGIGEQEEPRLVLDPDCAIYLMPRPADADPVIEYRSAHRLLVVNAAAPLPVLHARCACLCSGRAPIRRDVAPGVAFDHYVNVDPQSAASLLLSLGVVSS